MDFQPSSSVAKLRARFLQPYAGPGARRAAWMQLLPPHRLTVIAKTPMLVAVGVYASGGPFRTMPVALTLLVTSGLWAVLYAVNEATDLEGENHLAVDIGIRRLLAALCVGVILAGAAVTPRLALLLTLMVAGQLIYCLPPIRLKRRWWAVLLLSGVLNPILRLECGALWGPHAIPPLAYAVFVSLHLGASIRSRCLLRDRDRKLGYRVAPERTEWVGMTCTAVGLCGGYVLSAQGVLPPIFVLFTTIAALFSFYAWSGRVTSVARLRQGWLWFSLLSLLALAVLLSQHPR
jgi:hypothetical protein